MTRRKEVYFVYGMHCAACSSTIQNKLSKTKGVIEVNVNLLTKKMNIEYDEDLLSSQKIKDIVLHLGYKVVQKDDINGPDEFKNSKQKLIISLIFGIPLVFIVMLAMFKVEPFVSFAYFKHGIFYVLFQIAFLVPIIIINFHYFSSGFKNLFLFHPNMDSLIAIGTVAATLYSFIHFFEYFIFEQIEYSNHFVLHNFYFETAGMILVIVTIGKYLEAKAKTKTNDSINKLLSLMPMTANLITDEGIKVVDTSTVEVGNILLVKPGEKIPLDGVIVDGRTSIDESVVTGESLPVYKEVGSLVTIATQNMNGSIKIEVMSTTGNTWLDGIVHLVEEASSTKSKVERLADRISLFFVPVVIIISLLTFILWKIFNQTTSDALMSAISVLVIACPCSLGLATPTSIMVGMGKAAQYGILFKNAEVLEDLGATNRIVFDKTGTLTEGKPQIVKFKTYGAFQEEELFKISASIESRSEHPLAFAICDYFEENYDDSLYQVDNFHSHSGKGLEAVINDIVYYIGSSSFIKEILGLSIELPSTVTTKIILASSEILGMIEITDQIKETTIFTINELKKRKIKMVIATGDNEIIAKDVKEKLGVEEALYQLLPTDKMNYIKNCQEKGEKVTMVGDGINDSVALTVANIGIAIGAGTDIAKEAADVVLVKNDLLDVVHAYDLSKKVIRNIKQNLFWALIYNVIGILMTAGLYYLITGHPFNPMFGAIAMSLSSVCVVSNALLLKRISFNYPKREEFMSNQEINQGENKMTKIIKIEGLMCNNCERHVKNGLERLPGVSAEVSYQKKEAIVILKDFSITDDMLKKQVEEEGYQVISIK